MSMLSEEKLKPIQSMPHLQSLVASLQHTAIYAILSESKEAATFRSTLQSIMDQTIEILRQFYDRPNFAEDHGRSLRQAKLKVDRLTDQVLKLRDLSFTDIEAALDNDPATHDPYEVMLCYPGFRATLTQRLAHLFWREEIPLLPRLMTALAHQQTGIDIHPGAQLGSHFFIDHGTGVVIGETAEIGNKVTLYQGVTLGAKKFIRDQAGRIVKGNPRHPILENGVTVYAGATILGRIRIGEGSIIGGNVWVTESVPPRSRITQQHYLSSCFTDGDGI